MIFVVGSNATRAPVQPRHVETSAGQSTGATDDEWPREHAHTYHFKPTDAGSYGSKYSY